jgi:hypothetical protein
MDQSIIEKFEIEDLTKVYEEVKKGLNVANLKLDSFTLLEANDEDKRIELEIRRREKEIES